MRHYGDLYNQKINANIVSIYNREEMFTYTQNSLTDCLVLEECMIWTLDFTENSCLKIKKNY